METNGVVVCDCHREIKNIVLKVRKKMQVIYKCCVIQISATRRNKLTRVTDVES